MSEADLVSFGQVLSDQGCRRDLGGGFGCLFNLFVIGRAAQIHAQCFTLKSFTEDQYVLCSSVQKNDSIRVLSSLYKSDLNAQDSLMV